MSFECGICIEPVADPVCGQCMHHFCYACMVKLLRVSDRCPKCRETFLVVRRDAEFASVLGVKSRVHESYKTIKVDFSGGMKAKVTLLPLKW